MLKKINSSQGEMSFANFLRACNIKLYTDKIDSGPYTAMSVSYTHLDVYKRQGLTPISQPPGKGTSAFLKRPDVYKRQTQFNPKF